MKSKMKVLLLTALMAIAILAPSVAFAADAGTWENPFSRGLGSQATVADIVRYLVKILVTIGGIVIFIMFAVAGILYLTGAGNDDQIGRAKKLMIDSIIGLVILLAAWTLASFITQRLIGGTSNTIPNF